jgi:hypothetical protein
MEMDEKRRRHLAAAKARFLARRAGRRPRAQERRVPPDPPPRYDADFYEIGRILEEQEGGIPTGLIVGFSTTLDVVEGLIDRFGIDARLMDVRAELLRETGQ